MLDRIEHGDVLELRLARPPANALSPELIAALLENLRSTFSDGTGAVVLSGAPGMFSAGLDVPHLLTLDRDAIHSAWSDFYRLMATLATSPVPVAAAITGHSPAGGAVMTLFCDYRVMAAGDFKIGLNEVQVGIPLPRMIHRALKRVVGQRQSERMAMGGLMLGADEALRIGLVDELVDPAEVIARAVDWAQGILGLPSNAMSSTRAFARAELGELFELAGEEEIEDVVEVWFSAETQAALRALVERLAQRAAAKR